MKTRRLWELRLSTAAEAEDAVVELVQRVLGTSPATYWDAHTGALKVSAYVDADPAGMPGKRAELKRGLAELKDCGLSIGPGRVRARSLRRENWAESWKKHFKAFKVGAALLIKPDWSRRRPRHGQAVVVLNPGLSFGTGQHPTTAFCLRQIVENRVSGGKRSLLDIGTGSGILALAAAKLGYAPVHAFDNDPDSVRIAKANAQRNRVAQAVRVTAGDVTRMPLRGRKYSVVCANLIALLLVREHRRIVARVAEGGCLVLAGILRPEFEQVREVYERAGMKLLASGARKEWRSGAFLKGRSCIRGSARRVASA